MVDGLLHTDGAKRRSSDSKNDKSLHLIFHLFGVIFYFLNDLFLIIGQVSPVHFSIYSFFLHGFVRLGRFSAESRKLSVGYAVLSDIFFHHVVVIYPESHFIGLFSCICHFRSSLKKQNR